MGKSNVVELKNPEIIDALTELLRTGAQRIIAEAFKRHFRSRFC